MKRYGWYILLGISLTLLSVASYSFQIQIFHRTEDTFFYMLQDLAFVPIQVLVVTLIINELLSRREKSAMLKKLNMLIGVFFSEIGLHLLKTFPEFDHSHEGLRKNLLISNLWTEKDFKSADKILKTHNYNLDCNKANLHGVRDFLVQKRGFLLTLMGNPNLFEHEAFTNLLWSVFHLIEEFVYRPDLTDLPDTDYQHIANDMKRVYILILSEWLLYMKHLQKDYPYLFYLAVATNPFNPDARQVPDKQAS